MFVGFISLLLRKENLDSMIKLVKRLSIKLLGILLLCFSVLPVSAQQPDNTKEPIKVMLLGTVHLDNPGRDAINPKVPDVLTPQKQKELQTIRDAIADFEPNKVALEVRMKHQDSFDSLYQKFRSGRLDTFSVGDFVSKRSEHYQIGFKLADRLNHEHVYAIDHFIPMQLGKVMSLAKENDPAFIEYIQQYKTGELTTTKDSLLQNGTLQEVYRLMNKEETIEKYRAPYVRSLSVGNDTSYVGADVVADYHRRNLRIYANLMKIAEPGDRIFMLFGAGHQAYIRPLLKASPRVEFVDPMDYL